MAVRTLLLVLLATSRDGVWKETFFWMGPYGAPTCKPSKVWGTAPWIAKLCRSLNKKQRKKLAEASKKLNITTTTHHYYHLNY